MNIGDEVLLVVSTCVVLILVFIISTIVFIVFGPKAILSLLALFITVGCLRIAYLLMTIK